MTPSTVNMIVLTLLGFLLGSLMWSYWLGKWVLRRDIREIGDGNPGAFNLMKTGNRTVALVGVMLDIGKGVIPTGLALTFLPVTEWQLVPVAIAPVLGHAFSPFLRFKGGKAVAALGGAHLGMQPDFTLLIGIPVFVLSYLVINLSGWAMAVTLFTLMGLQAVLRPSAPLMVIWIIHTALILYKYRADLRQPFGFKRRKAAR
ncbi:MAG: glycerol-3-phosphate acyltransferase [bacterium]|nr:glycerol-3-phosphate acyltransferase [bacterium]